MAFKFDDISINTLVGSGSFFSGDIKVNGFIRIDGDIEGDLETDGSVIISEKARFKGNIKAKAIIVGGIVLGNISATEGIKLLSTSAVIGNIISHSVQMEENVIFHGYCISLKDAKKFDEASETFLQQKAIRDKATFL